MFDLTIGHVVLKHVIIFVSRKEEEAPIPGKWWTWFPDGQNFVNLEFTLGFFSTNITALTFFYFFISPKHQVSNMYLLTEWEGRTGKYLARGHGVRTERSEVRAPWPRAKYFPVRPDLTQSISILSYDHRAFQQLSASAVAIVPLLDWSLPEQFLPSPSFPFLQVQM